MTWISIFIIFNEKTKNIFIKSIKWFIFELFEFFNYFSDKNKFWLKHLHNFFVTIIL